MRMRTPNAPHRGPRQPHHAELNGEGEDSVPRSVAARDQRATRLGVAYHLVHHRRRKGPSPHLDRDVDRKVVGALRSEVPRPALLHHIRAVRADRGDDREAKRLGGDLEREREDRVYAARAGFVDVQLAMRDHLLENCEELCALRRRARYAFVADVIVKDVRGSESNCEQDSRKM
jgi:hypothetical protein